MNCPKKKINIYILILHAAPLKVTDYNTDATLRKAEVWRRNELTGDRGLIETDRKHVQECESIANPRGCFRPILGAFTTM